MDFQTVSGSATILAGQQSVLIDINVLDDSILEDNESITVTLDQISSGNPAIAISSNDTASVVIADDDSATVNIIATDPDASEPSDAGQFAVTLDFASDTDTTVSYTVSGDAIQGTDVVALSGTVTIPAGETFAIIDLSVIDDDLVESTETLSVTLDQITAGDSEISVGTNTVSYTHLTLPTIYSV